MNAKLEVQETIARLRLHHSLYASHGYGEEATLTEGVIKFLETVEAGFGELEAKRAAELAKLKADIEAAQAAKLAAEEKTRVIEVNQ